MRFEWVRAMTPAIHRAVFLDRDGVLNQVVLRAGRPYPPASLAELVLLPGVREACQALRAGGFQLVMVTNQPDVGRGTQTREAVDAINDRLRHDLALDGVQVCLHDDGDHCACRKPKPGMLTSAAQELGIDLSRSFLVGDRWRDIEAGQRAGVRTIWIDCQYQEQPPARPGHTVQNLAQAADWILKLAENSTG